MSLSDVYRQSVHSPVSGRKSLAHLAQWILAINICIHNGKFPTELKKARVTPVYTHKGSKMEYSNYKSIACISYVTKVLEKVIHQQLKDHVFDHHFITNGQLAYTMQVWPFDRNGVPQRCYRPSKKVTNCRNRVCFF